MRKAKQLIKKILCILAADQNKSTNSPLAYNNFTI